MQIFDVTNDEECCCSCKHNIRKQDEDGYINCQCDIDSHYIGYVANFESVCEEWKDAYNK
jgi:hypothetical protein